MAIIGFFIPILNVVDEHVLNKTNYTNNNQTELGYFILIYILRHWEIKYLFIHNIFYATYWIINRIFVYINKNQMGIQDAESVGGTYSI